MSPASSKSLVTVAGRLIKISRGAKSQTINVCTPANIEGTYEVTYRLARDVEVTTDALAELLDLDSVEKWALARGAETDAPSAPANPPVTPLVPLPAAKDPWLAEARKAVDRALRVLVEQFCANPYLHRVEHSIHTTLYSLLKSEPVLADTVELKGGQVTQLVHKEWPETIPRFRGGDRPPRGNFDIGIITPQQASSATLSQFLEGRIAAPLVVEVGLDYGLDHLAKDVEKLVNSQVPVPYLLHLSRVGLRNQRETESYIHGLGSDIHVAYVQIDPSNGARWVKHLDDPQVTAR
jgi:hypothetical protein